MESEERGVRGTDDELMPNSEISLKWSINQLLYIINFKLTFFLNSIILSNILSVNNNNKINKFFRILHSLTSLAPATYNNPNQFNIYNNFCFYFCKVFGTQLEHVLIVLDHYVFITL